MSLPIDNAYPTTPEDPLPHSKALPHHNNKIGYADSYSKNHTSTAPKTNSNAQGPGRATSERIPTSTWGSFTIVTVVLLLIVTCLILNCNRIRRKVTEKRIGKVKRSAEPFSSFEKRHKELQEAEVEWDNHQQHQLVSQRGYSYNNSPVYQFYPTAAITTTTTATATSTATPATTEMMYHANHTHVLTTPESVMYSSSSKNSSVSSSNASTMAHNPALLLHTSSSSNSTNSNHEEFLKSHHPPGVQLRMTLDNSSSSSLPNLMTVVVEQQQQHQQQPTFASPPQQQQQYSKVAPAANINKALPTFQ